LTVLLFVADLHCPFGLQAIITKTPVLEQLGNFQPIQSAV
jgi:hypothetical protein